MTGKDGYCAANLLVVDGGPHLRREEKEWGEKEG